MNPRSLLAVVAASVVLVGSAIAEDIHFGKDFSLKGEPAGESVDLESLKGKPFVMYWGSLKCGRCVAVVDDLGRLAKNLERKGVPVIAVQSEGATREEVEAYMKKNRLKLPYYPSNDHVTLNSSSEEVKRLFRGIPRYMVFDAEGKMSQYFGDAGEARRAVEKLMK